MALDSKTQAWVARFGVGDSVVIELVRGREIEEEIDGLLFRTSSVLHYYEVLEALSRRGVDVTVRRIHAEGSWP
jgi:hypothetical protein